MGHRTKDVKLLEKVRSRVVAVKVRPATEPFEKWQARKDVGRSWAAVMNVIFENHEALACLHEEFHGTRGCTALPFQASEPDERYQYKALNPKWQRETMAYIDGLMASLCEATGAIAAAPKSKSCRSQPAPEPDVRLLKLIVKHEEITTGGIIRELAELRRRLKDHGPGDIDREFSSMSRGTLHRKLRQLKDRDLVTQPRRGAYRITDKGRKRLHRPNKKASRPG